jgi:hypothetical protein
MVANTIARVTNGINDIGASANPHPVINNVITGLTDPNTGYHIKMNSNSAAVSEMKNNLIFEPSGKFRVYWGQLYSSLGAFKAGTGKGDGCLVSDPQFADEAGNNFALKSSSPAKDMATVPSLYTDLFAALFPGNSIAFDLTGVSRPQGETWDIGAFEIATDGEVPGPPANFRIVGQ